jgi:hypothetical protein
MVGTGLVENLARPGATERTDNRNVASRLFRGDGTGVNHDTITSTLSRANSVASSGRRLICPPSDPQFKPNMLPFAVTEVMQRHLKHLPKTLPSTPERQ